MATSEMDTKLKSLTILRTTRYLSAESAASSEYELLMNRVREFEVISPSQPPPVPTVIMRHLKRKSFTEVDVASKRSSKVIVDPEVNESMREMDEKIYELNADTLARYVAAIRPIADSEVISQTPPVARPISAPVHVPLPSEKKTNAITKRRHAVLYDHPPKPHCSDKTKEKPVTVKAPRNITDYFKNVKKRINAFASAMADPIEDTPTSSTDHLTVDKLNSLTITDKGFRG